MTQNRVLMMGNEAIGEGAIRAGCDSYFGYPITPQNELSAYMAVNMPANARVFVQAESEIAAINMVYGAASTGKRAMTSSSGPGISLKQEGISFLAGAELPAVIVNVQRGGPGLGNIAPSQGDYFQAVRGGGHGDYQQIVLAPYCVQEMYDLTMLAFELADAYRTPTMVLADGRLGQMMEPVVFSSPKSSPPAKPWATTGAVGRPPNIVRSLYLKEEELEAVNLRLQGRYAEVRRKEVRYDAFMTDDCDVLLVAYGSCARIAKSCVLEARSRGCRAGLLRPITLWPFPAEPLAELAKRQKGILVVEMSAGQMLEDVRLSVGCDVPVLFEGRMGGVVPSQHDILKKIMDI